MRHLFVFSFLLMACGGAVESTDELPAENPRCMTFHNTWSCADEPFDVGENARPCGDGCAVGEACALHAKPWVTGVCR